MSTHDMEMALREELHIAKELGDLPGTSAEATQLESYICKHLVVANPRPVSLHLLGFESMPNGITHFYLESDATAFSPEMTWIFDLLMNHFTEQQNKLTFYFRDQQETLTFLPTIPSQTLKLETNGL